MKARFFIAAALAVAFCAAPASAHRCRSATTGRFIKCPVPVPTPPPPPPPAPVVRTRKRARAPSLPGDKPAGKHRLGRTYKAVEFGHRETGEEFVVLSDATHLGDGWFALFVPTTCVQLG
jgi:hypothetical protein